MERNRPSDTLRIDLIPGATRETETTQRPSPEPQTPPPSMRVRRTGRPEEPPAVARSRYQELLQSVYDAAILTNLQGRITEANVRAVEFFQYSRDDLCSMRIQDIVSGADNRLLETLCEALRNERFTLIQAYCRRRDGTFFPSEVAVNMLRFGQIYLCFFIRDITLRKQAEDRLRLEHEALQHAASGIAIADADMTIEYANPAFSLAVGKEDQNSLVGRSLFDLAADADAMRSLTGAASQSSAPWKGTVELLSGTGTSLFQACAVNCLDEDGEPCGLILSLGERESPASQAATP